MDRSAAVNGGPVGNGGTLVDRSAAVNGGPVGNGAHTAFVLRSLSSE